MTESVTRDSVKFPPGYGNFMLQSSDGVVCHFPRHLLEYMSPVFKDMFSASEGVENYGSTKSPQSSPLKMEESSVAIELLLEHIDPKSKRILPICSESILELLEAARKYQVTTITEWFTEQVALSQIDRSSGESVSTPSFVSIDPDVALQAALRFELPHIGRLALRELAGGPPPSMDWDNPNIQPRVFKYQSQLREERVTRYREHVSALANAVKQNIGGSSQACGCVEVSGIWLLTMERAITANPRWSSFSTAYESRGKCGPNVRYCSARSWTQGFKELLETWERDATRLEAELPEWPF